MTTQVNSQHTSIQHNLDKQMNLMTMCSDMHACIHTTITTCINPLPAASTRIHMLQCATSFIYMHACYIYSGVCMCMRDLLLLAIVQQIAIIICPHTVATKKCGTYKCGIQRIAIAVGATIRQMRFAYQTRKICITTASNK